MNCRRVPRPCGVGRPGRCLATFRPPSALSVNCSQVSGRRHDTRQKAGYRRQQEMGRRILVHWHTITHRCSYSSVATSQQSPFLRRVAFIDAVRFLGPRLLFGCHASRTLRSLVWLSRRHAMCPFYPLGSEGKKRLFSCHERAHVLPLRRDSKRVRQVI